jgi:hypothetical protein
MNRLDYMRLTAALTQIGRERQNLIETVPS